MHHDPRGPRWGVTEALSQRGECPEGVCQWIARQATAQPDAVAILADQRPAMTYDRLIEAIDRTRSRLKAMGIEPGDRVAIVLPNGPEMVVAFLAVASIATAAPLNPNYRAPEFDFYLSDLNAKALITQAGDDTPATVVATSRGMATIELSVRKGAAAGAFDLRVTGNPHGIPRVRHGADAALVLHTSGTTSRPKIVPLTWANLCASACHIRQSLQLTPEDRCLNVMPLFHIHGLVAATLASLSAGASLVCTNGFVATVFFDWLKAYRPTWYTAVPTMHQAILSRAASHRLVTEHHTLRLVRSSSSSLPPSVAQPLERMFGVPVIEAYGMTEAAHQICCNPLPPRDRRFGSVGVPAGPDVAVMDEKARLLESGQTGEVVIRGPNVTRGYENNPEANAKAFNDGWFRTGDQGYFDPDGYLHLTGRLKELIIRAGENIAPREVDEALLEHPAVKQAVAFAVPDQRLGEEVGAAIVLREGHQADDHQLRRFVAQRLADHKVPRRIVVLDEIPKGPTGKLQRIGLAQKLGLTGDDPGAAHSAYVPPCNSHESMFTEIWQQVLRVDRIGVHDDFFALGGDSVLAAQVIVRVADRVGVTLPMLVFFEMPTVQAMARGLAKIEAGITAQARPAGSGQPESTLDRMLEQLEQMSEEEAQHLT